MNLQTILVPVDFSDVTSKVVKAAGELARMFGSRLVLLHVSEPEPDFVGFEAGPQSVRVGVAREVKAEHAQLDELKRTLTEEGREVLALHIQGPIVEKILQEAETHQAGMIVVGSHGHGALYTLLVGSVTSGLLKSARCPMLVVPSAVAE
ncbi:MAG: universal stress protein [Verrucomicrobiaceae bacterium]|nr:MAG: universal stress protein [Verrucomicrobiaceae bacterium]